MCSLCSQSLGHSVFHGVIWCRQRGGDLGAVARLFVAFLFAITQQLTIQSTNPPIWNSQYYSLISLTSHQAPLPPPRKDLDSRRKKAGETCLEIYCSLLVQWNHFTWAIRSVFSSLLYRKAIFWKFQLFIIAKCCHRSI